MPIMTNSLHLGSLKINEKNKRHPLVKAFFEEHLGATYTVDKSGLIILGGSFSFSGDLKAQMCEFCLSKGVDLKANPNALDVGAASSEPQKEKKETEKASAREGENTKSHAAGFTPGYLGTKEGSKTPSVEPSQAKKEEKGFLGMKKGFLL